MIVAFIPARSGSKSIPLKNIKIIAGKPLIYWSIAAAENCINIDKIYVSTDSEEIKAIVESFNFTKVIVIERSADTASDTASTESAMLEFANKHVFDHIVLVQATSPLTTSEDLNNAINKYFSNNYDSLFSAVRQKRFIWEIDDYGLARPKNYDYNNRPKRQEFSGFLVENGAFYICSRENLLKYKNRLCGKIGVYEMDGSSYFETDEKEDWTIVEEFLKTTKGLKKL